MADPISLGLTVAAGATGAIGSIFGGQANSAMYNYQAGIAAMNAQIARQNAAYEYNFGETQAQLSGMKARAGIAETRAKMGAGGLDINTGTNRAVLESEVTLANYDESLTRANAARRAYGDQVEAIQDDAQSQLDRYAASTSLTAGYIGAATSILSAGGSFSSKWMQGQQVGNVSGPLAGAW